MFEDYDFQTGDPICHLAIIGQEYSGLDHWILGESFMQEFYIGYYDKGEEGLQVAISQNKPDLTLLIRLLLIGGVTVAIIAVILGIYYGINCYKKRQKSKGERTADLLNSRRKLGEDVEYSDDEDE